MALQTMFSAKPNSPQTTLTAQISADATTMTVADGSVLASAPNLLTIGTDENAEVVYYTTLSGNTVSGLVRGYSGTTASVWSEGTQVAREYTSYDHDTFINNFNALQGYINTLSNEVEGKQDTLTFDTTPTANSNNPVTSNGVKTYADNKILYFSQQTVSVASSAQIMRIPASGTNSAITENTVVLECTFANPTAITSDVTWTSYAGYITFSGTCTAATTANVTLGQKGN